MISTSNKSAPKVLIFITCSILCAYHFGSMNNRNSEKVIGVKAEDQRSRTISH